MANIKSAIKRIQTSERNRLQNKSYKSAVRTLMKKYFIAVEDYGSAPSSDKLKEVNQRMSETYSKIDKAVKKGVFHRNNGARKKARIAKALQRYAPDPTSSTAS
ncbi:MAG: 30S ribosomal protein S20 [Microcoleaceae cyanobacterium]